tara:strand:- start:2703 stop:3152 length:450 start_codon:yes stop_codon:yes gene_type:complete
MLKPKFVPARWVLVIAAVGILSACSDEKITGLNLSARWYSPEQLSQGKALFANNCAACHGALGEGAKDWKTVDKHGFFPAPPINGSAHAWHHSLEVLLRTVNVGGASLGGSMPGFQGSLTESEQRSVIAAFQDYWPDDIYQKWRVINSR